jgi:hypothetical protein
MTILVWNSVYCGKTSWKGEHDEYAESECAQFYFHLILLLLEMGWGAAYAGVVSAMSNACAIRRP